MSVPCLLSILFVKYALGALVTGGGAEIGSYLFLHSGGKGRVSLDDWGDWSDFRSRRRRIGG